MTATVETKKPTPNEQKKANDLTLLLKGRIKSYERVESSNGDFYSTLLVLPAEDEYSYPRTFAVNASAPLGSREQDVEVSVEARPNNRKTNGTYYHNISFWRVEENQDRPF